MDEAIKRCGKSLKKDALRQSAAHSHQPLTSLGGPIKSVSESSHGTNTVQNATTNTNNSRWPSAFS